MPRYIGDFEVDGQQIVERFETYLLTGALTTTAQFRNVTQTGPPLFGVRNVQTGALMAGLTVDLDTPFQGQHKMLVDFSIANGYAVNGSYELFCSNGSVNADGIGGWVVVSAQSILTWGGQLRSDGQLLQRVVKLADFTVESGVHTTTDFVISVPSVSSPEPNYFSRQNIIWDPGSSNHGVGRAIRSSIDAGGGNIAIQLVEPLPRIPQQGDTGVIQPEERAAETYWANIRPRFGGPDTYLVEWFTGTEQVDVDAGQNCLLTVTRASTDVRILNSVPMSESIQEPGWFNYTEAVNLIASGDSARVEVAAQINGALRTWSRTLAN